MLFKEAKDKVYQNLMEYALQKCDVIMVTKRCDQHLEEHTRVVNYLLKDTGYSIDEVVEKYSYSFLDSLYERYKDDSYIFHAIFHVRNNCLAMLVLLSIIFLVQSNFRDLICK